MNHRHRLTALLVTAALTATLGACTNDRGPYIPPDPADARWALTAADLGDGVNMDRGIKHFGEQACLGPSLLFDLADALPIKNTEYVGVSDIDGDINAVSAVVHVDGVSSNTGAVQPRSPQGPIRQIWDSVSDYCLGGADRYPDRVSYEILGRAPDFDAKPFEPAFGFKSTENGPWTYSPSQRLESPDVYGETSLDDYTNRSRSAEGVTEWHTVVWVTVADDSTIIVVGAEGPRDPATVLDLPALLQTVADRVNNDPPDPEWDWTW